MNVAVYTLTFRGRGDDQERFEKACPEIQEEGQEGVILWKAVKTLFQGRNTLLLTIKGC